ncbi:MAG: hypothetical protein LBD12_00455 [Clostridiales Family XIII bacterium]|nr:hypothetical protein [Clostridiales Family XIII bacterium]
MIDYWGRIPKALADCGIPVYYGQTDAWGSIESNAECIRGRIGDILRDEGTEKVNIVAHSRGGLEARHAISTLGMAHAVASLTTIATPHHGVKAMNIALGLPLWFYRLVAFVVDRLARLFGDRQPDFFTSSRQLSERCCRRFNECNPDSPDVYCQSYAARMKHCFGDPFYLLMNPFIRLTDGENDGLCPVESAKWGEFQGVVVSQGLRDVSHIGIIDRYGIRYKGWDIPSFYVGIVEALARKGM